MIKLSLILLLTHLLTLASGQVIHGRVLDQETKMPIDYASVFFNGTFVGTTTDENGAFELDITDYVNRPLFISAVGYKTSSLTSLSKRKQFDVYLQKVLYELPEVEIESKSLIKERAHCMKIFREEFLGRSRNAKGCIILNEESITFNYKNSKDTLRAIALKPLIILNNSLGYRITYHLDKFEFDRSNKTTSFSGNIIFNLDMAESGNLKKVYMTRRENAYYGSCKHFFSALWYNRLSEEGFRVQEVESVNPLPYDKLVQVDREGRKYFSYNQDLEIAYNYHLTTVTFRFPSVYFDKDGFFDPEAILWYGYMAVARLADWLPYEYSPGF